MELPTIPSASSPGQDQAPSSPASHPGLSRAVVFFLFVGGVLLPLLTFAIEVATGLCAGIFIDPIPTVWFALLVLAVPLANAASLCARQWYPSVLEGPAAPWLLRANAWAIGIAACYSLAFLPLAPFAVVGVLFFGLGLLPLSPLLSLISAVALRRTLHRLVPGTRPPTAPPVLLGMALVLGALVPNLVTDWAVSQLARGSNTPVALSWLRRAASETHLLENARGQGTREKLRWMRPAAAPHDYEVAYYRATGLSPRTVPDAAGLLFRPDTGRRWAWDSLQGQQQVGARLENLKLVESRLEAAAHPAAATGYTEWTLVFANTDQFQQAEARALVQLPDGGVVSRLTLWIDGEEREAAFGGKSQVTQAYQAVVSRRRDPVLVTHQGAGRVLLQCFPVPPAGEMKVRIGITYPLLLNDTGGRVVWPRLIERNFHMADNFRHTLWSTNAATPSLSPALPPASPATPKTFRTELTTAELAAGLGSFEVAGGNTGPVYAVVPDGTHRRVRQDVVLRPGAGDGLAIVLDGSAGMVRTGRALASALDQLSPGIRVDLWLSGDRLLRAPATSGPEVAGWLRDQTFRGGQDNIPALLAAYDAVLGRRPGVVLWIHGAQPYTWNNTSALVQRFARDRDAVTLCDYSAGWSENPRLTELAHVVPLRRIDPLGMDPTEMIHVLRLVTEPSRVAVRKLDASAEPAAAPDSRQVGRLWASEEVERLMRGDRPRRAEAVHLGREAQLVTSVTGAVVLETQAQYDDAGLKPVDPSTTPSIPEPAAVALVGGVLALLFAWRKRGGARFGRCATNASP